MAFINVNSDAVVKFSDKLERSSRSAFPVAVRQTLNDAAFADKKRLPAIAKKEFTVRNKGFFPRFSKVEKAQGFNVNTMNAQIGFIPTEPAARNLEQQEKGGRIKDRSFVPMDKARTGKKHEKLVRKKFRVEELKKQGVRQVRKGGKKGRSRFIRAVFQAGTGGLVLYGNTLFHVDKINNKAKGRAKLKITPLYDYQKGRAVQVQATNFMARNSKISARQMDNFYIKNAKKRLIKAGLL